MTQALLMCLALVLQQTPSGIVSLRDMPLQDDAGLTPLFNGKTLEGWTPIGGGTWKVRDGAIVGEAPKSERRHGLQRSRPGSKAAYWLRGIRVSRLKYSAVSCARPTSSLRTRVIFAGAGRSTRRAVSFNTRMEF